MCEQGTAFISIREAAALLDTTEMRVLMMLRQKVLIGRLLDDGWEVDRSSLQECRKPRADEVVRSRGCGGGCGSGCDGHRKGGAQ